MKPHAPMGREEKLLLPQGLSLGILDKKHEDDLTVRGVRLQRS